MIECSEACEPIFVRKIFRKEKSSEEESEQLHVNYAADQVIEEIFADTESEKSFVTVVAQKSSELDFTEARQKELDGLMSRKIFEVVDRKAVPKGKKIFGMR